jgi:uncharacterized membrane protein YbhN (UPF0104 family)
MATPTLTVEGRMASLPPSPARRVVGPGAPPPGGRRRLVGCAKVVVALGLLAWLVRSGRLDLARLAHIPASGALVALAALTLGALLLPAVRWWLLLRVQRLHEPLGRVLLLSWASYFWALVLPGAAGGDVAKGYLILRHRAAGRARALSTVLTDRVLGIYSLLLLGTLSVAWQAWCGPLPEAAAAMAVGVVLLFLGATAVLGAFYLAACRRLLLRAVPRAWREPVAESFALYADTPVVVAGCLLLSVLSNAMVLASFTAAGAVLGQTVPPGAAFLAGPLVVLANCLPLSPGGLGVAETAAAGLFAGWGILGGADMMVLVRLSSAGLALPGLLAPLGLSGTSRHALDNRSEVVADE